MGTCQETKFILLGGHGASNRGGQYFVRKVGEEMWMQVTPNKGKNKATAFSDRQRVLRDALRDEDALEVRLRTKDGKDVVITGTGNDVFGGRSIARFEAILDKNPSAARELLADQLVHLVGAKGESRTFEQGILNLAIGRLDPMTVAETLLDANLCYTDDGVVKMATLLHQKKTPLDEYVEQRDARRGFTTRPKANDAYYTAWVHSRVQQLQELQDAGIENLDLLIDANAVSALAAHTTTNAWWAQDPTNNPTITTSASDTAAQLQSTYPQYFTSDLFEQELRALLAPAVLTSSLEVIDSDLDSIQLFFEEPRTVEAEPARKGGPFPRLKRKSPQKTTDEETSKPPVKATKVSATAAAPELDFVCRCSTALNTLGLTPEDRAQYNTELRGLAQHLQAIDTQWQGTITTLQSTVHTLKATAGTFNDGAESRAAEQSLLAAIIDAPASDAIYKEAATALAKQALVTIQEAAFKASLRGLLDAERNAERAPALSHTTNSLLDTELPIPTIAAVTDLELDQDARRALDEERTAR